MSFVYRTEELEPERILDLFVETEEDRVTVDKLKAIAPIVLEGSRGIGKSFLMRVAEGELHRDFEADRIMPVYLSFIGSSLIQTSDTHQFQNWMLGKLCFAIVRALKKKGLITGAGSMSLLGSRAQPGEVDVAAKFEEITRQYEDSWRRPGSQVDASMLPDTQDFMDAIEDICKALEIRRFCVFFDEAAHIFRPEQQRQFFTLFRDLRSPYITCNAAVYPGVTTYGSTFQLAHDASLRRVERDIESSQYVQHMFQILARQADEPLLSTIDTHKQNFAVMAYAVSGNPRFLLKTVANCPKMTSKEVDTEIKRFYRSEIWAEHSKLAEKYPGHRPLVDWGREFLEKTVIPATQQKNAHTSVRDRTQATSYFWVHRDVPQVVKEALRLLEYMGLIRKIDEAVTGTRSGLGTRYALNLGILFAFEANPLQTAPDITRDLSLMRFTEFGANHSAYKSLINTEIVEPNMQEVLVAQLQQTIDILDITEWQAERVKEAGLNTIGDLLRHTEEDLMGMVKRFGPARSRKVTNAAMTAVLEYLSG